VPGLTAPLRIRPARDEDLSAIHAIECASFGDPWSVASFRSMLAQPQVLATVAERGGEILGYGIAWHLADEAEIANLAVAPDARRAGVARALLDDLLAGFAARGGATVYLEVRAGNSAAQALYRSRGFDEVGRRRGYYDAPKEDAIVMRRPMAD
jgi:ribosomal-protein-alanine N-acetyltransferase